MRPPRRLNRPASPLSHRLRDVGAIALIIVFGVLANDWTAGVGLAVLFAGWKYLLREPGPPIVAAAFSMQWLQVMAALVYFAISTRQIQEMQGADYQPMVLIGLASVVTLFSGFYFAAGFRRHKSFREGHRLLPWPTKRIIALYFCAVAGSGILQDLAWSTPGLTQPLIVFSRIRYVFLYFLVTRLMENRKHWPVIAGILLAEIALGFSGFFAEFREPLVVVGAAVLGTMDRRRTRTWVIVGSLVILGVASAFVWSAIKPVVRSEYAEWASRTQRLRVAVTATGTTFGVGTPEWKRQSDALVSRIWAIYFPALALKRVPSDVPYQNGAILWGAIQNVLTPRLFFPDKPSLPSQSDEVREYAGVWVAGREANTSFAFGYVGEAYVDFGVPLMFLPILGWGLLVGFAYRWLRNHVWYDELRTGITIVIVWSTLGSYEAAWVMMIGPTLTIMLVLGGGAVLVDRFHRARPESLPPAAQRKVSASMADSYRLKSQAGP
ncbi:MAG TPA: hypothetical protein VM939_09070 [Gemmatimonadaceae bacterium]|nr:hypothetical protein [Gemmatimonadaceae bacterium]